MTTNTPNAQADAQSDYKKFICLACGYIYDEAVGDPEDGLPAGTRFADIPDDWQCPLCGVKKSDFIPYEETVAADAPLVTFDDARHGVVVVGGGLAGWSVIEAVRALDKDIPVTLIASDSADRYHKPMLSAAISQNKTPTELVRTTAFDATTTLNVRLFNDTFVTNIDSHAKVLHTTRGRVAYDDLVLAIGASPAYPPTIGKDMAWHINNLSRFAGLQARLKKSNDDNRQKSIAIVGAGMIGTELAEDLINAGHQVSLIDVHAYPLSTLLPSVAGERILKAIKNIGVNWLGYSMVQEVSLTPKGYEIKRLDCVTNIVNTLYFDELVVATGLIVDERLPTRAGVAFSRHTGIAVNPQTLETSVPHIYALGDCISIDGVPCRYVAPHRAQAAAIASQMLGQDGTYSHKPPMIRLKNKSISVTATGNPKSSGEWRIDSQTDTELLLTMIANDETIATATIKG